MKEKIVRIGCSSGFWGDTNFAAEQLVMNGKLDYLVSDYLAEVTMSILAGARLKNPEAGYAADFVETLIPLLTEIHKKGIKVISNAGGINPMACKDALEHAAQEAGTDLNIAVITGDNLMRQQDQIHQMKLKGLDNDQSLPEKLVSMNAYLGASPITLALDQGADIVITGRCVDSALVLGPLVHEFKWSWEDYNLLAAGSLAGHIIECGAQCTGGNFTDWEEVEGFHDMGFPIVGMQANGTFIVTKPERTGGLVSIGTVAEQLLYEIGDPGAYILPDVVCDFRQVQLKQVGENRVSVSGVKGNSPTGSYKVSATHVNGFRADATFMMGGIDAVRKGQRVADAILKRTSNLFVKVGFSDYTETNISLLGAESTYGEHARTGNTREVNVRISVKHPQKEALSLFGREIAQASTGMAPGLTSLIGGRPRPSPLICLFSFLIPKEMINVTILLGGKVTYVPARMEKGYKKTPEASETWTPDLLPRDVEVPLITLAFGRSGDKGDHANIGVIARKPEYLPYIKAALTVDVVGKYFNHLLEGDVCRWDVPGIHALNFLLRNSLGGGGMSSLRVDPQGKAYAQMLLDFPIPIPKSLI